MIVLLWRNPTKLHHFLSSIRVILIYWYKYRFIVCNKKIFTYCLLIILFVHSYFVTPPLLYIIYQINTTAQL